MGPKDADWMANNVDADLTASVIIFPDLSFWKLRIITVWNVQVFAPLPGDVYSLGDVHSRSTCLRCRTPSSCGLWKAEHIKMKKRTMSNAYQIPPAGQWRKLISRIQRPYKMAKFEKQFEIFFLAWHFFMHMLNISILLMQSIRNLQ